MFSLIARLKPTAWATAALAGALLWGAAAIASSPRVVYDAYVWAAIAWQSQGWQGLRHLTTGHFVVYYPPGRSADAQLVAAELEQALRVESRNLGQTLPFRLPVVLYDQAGQMNASVGMPARDRDVGFYWKGVIRLLTPEAWLGSTPSALAEYAQVGPVAHELGHALLAFRTYGNYPDWFNEGVAQMEDTAVTGWSAPRPPGPLYPVAALTQNFYQLPNQAMAYWEAQGMTTYLAHQGSAARFNQFLARLQAGTAFSQALTQTYGYSSPQALFDAWRASVGG